MSFSTVFANSLASYNRHFNKEVTENFETGVSQNFIFCLTIFEWVIVTYRDHTVHAASQWETVFQCNPISHWLGVYTVKMWQVIYSSQSLHRWTIIGHFADFFLHDDVIKLKHFRRYWPFVRGIHRSPVNSPHKGQRRGALMFSFSAWITDWVNNRESGDLGRHSAYYDVIVMGKFCVFFFGT